MKRIAILLCCLLPTLAFAAGQRFISIGTGGLTGVYYPAGGAICRLLKKEQRDHRIRCSVESTGGSIFNLNALASGEIDFGIAQSDWQHHAYEGSAKFSEQGPNRDLRAVFSIHTEQFTVMARDDSGIEGFTGLRGKRVNIGNPGSGQRGTMELLMRALGWQKSDFKLLSELKASEQARALCDNKIDAMIYAVGHPNASIKEAATACDAHLVPVTGKAVESLVAAHTYYTPSLIPGGLYRGTEGETRTFGTKASLVTSAKVDESVVYELVKAVFENLDSFRKLHPAFARLQAADMLQGQSVPFHAGAIKYFKEAGLM